MHSITDSQGSVTERTEVLYGNKNIQRVTVKVFSQIKERLDACLDHTEVAMHVLDD